MTDEQCAALGIAPADACVVASIPTIDKIPLEHPCSDMVIFSVDGLAIDGVRDHGRKAVKWWLVEWEARRAGLDLPKILWQGKGRDLDTAKWAGYAVRSYHHGPWIKLGEEE